MAQAAKSRTKSSSYQQARVAALGKAAAAAAPVVWDEQEPAGTGGSNDTLATAERITIFGTGASKNNAVRILGENAELEGGPTTALAPVPEDNGAIPLAGDTGLGASAATKTTSGELGDGPHGPAGDDSNDFDFYEVTVPAGLTLIADTSESGAVDTVLAVYDDAGELLAADDDGGSHDFTSRLVYTPPAPGTYFLMVGGYSFFGPLPEDPFDSGSGVGGADVGPYELSVGIGPVDTDRYAVQLKPGRHHRLRGLRRFRLAHRLPPRRRADGRLELPRRVLAVPGQLAAARRWQHHARPTSPSRRAGTSSPSTATWAPTRSCSRATGPARRPTGTSTRRSTSTSRVAGSTRASGAVPASVSCRRSASFLGKWGINANRQDAMITKVTAEVRRNIRNEVKAAGLNPGLEVTRGQLPQPPGGRGQAERLARHRRRDDRPSRASRRSASRSTSTRATSGTRTPRWCCSTC